MNYGNRPTPAMPLSPPPPLHLRNILPSSPEEPPSMPLPPRTPGPWVWQCHRCTTVYRLGATRRCLECAHTYCVSRVQQARNAAASKRKRRHMGLCGAEFDYTGWANWGSWRRKIAGCGGDPERDIRYARRRHNCWLDCDSPSQCSHRRHQLADEARRRRAEVYAALCGAGGFTPVNRLRFVEGGDDDDDDDDDEEEGNYTYDEEAVEDYEEEEYEAVEQSTPVKSPTSPKSPLSQTSFLWDEDEDEKGSEGSEEEGEVQHVKTEEEQAEDEEDEERPWLAPPTPASTPVCEDFHRVESIPKDGEDWTFAVFGKPKPVVDEDLTEKQGPKIRKFAEFETDNVDDHEGSETEESEWNGSGWSRKSYESDESSVLRDDGVVAVAEGIAA
ncbi:hypothetical protein F5Y03DRAFT_395065 [Xylaria venustula]|nr:hypothetical protein F5Y03DRAFT_395065 [Xylaria venustula]